ncbi:MAG: ABC transporter substrate-binding protein, partial [Hyphomicrobiales bacterium]|nr:ABC transporter substrate-binding protein [Hyphomicrobiales bacterium]
MDRHEPPHGYCGPVAIRSLRMTGAFLALICALVTPTIAEPQHAIAMHGDPLYPADFDHFRYADPNAPKGGHVTFAVTGGFDSLNPLIIKGRPVWEVRTHVYESLMARGQDEPFTLYGLIAESVETPPDRAWVEFTINSSARFSDSEPVTVDDVAFSFELLRDHGRPNHRNYYSKVARVERPRDRRIRFVFAEAGDRELPLIIALMPVLPKHLIDPESFEKTTLEPPVGSGPYIVTEVDPGTKIVFRRNPDYWGADLPARRGFDNFDEIRYEYYRDENTQFEAFKKGLIDVLVDTDPTRWATGYDFPAVNDGRVVREEFATETPKGMTGFVFNTRRPVFADIRVRKALAMLFDFEWVNNTYFFNAYRRTGSYFEGSALSALGRPASDRERQLLASFPDAIAPEVMDGNYRPMATDGSGRDRKPLRAAMALLTEAGYTLTDGRLVKAETGEPFTFEFLSKTREQERLALAYKRTLAQIGIEMSIRTVDSAQYQQRVTTFDFDMVLNWWPVSLSPGNEQSFRWSMESAELEGSFNYAGASEPAIDAMIAAMLAAKEADEFVDAVRALDRVLISGHYVVPL